MCQQILLNMKKGGKFVGVTPYVNERKYDTKTRKGGVRWVGWGGVGWEERKRRESG